jgi:diguanylate cyclase (GGDEF)-like protein/PAS domain S-box-containing protein
MAGGMSQNPIRNILLIEDSPGDARLLREMFSEQGASDTALTHVECLRDAEAHLAQHPADIILLDLGLPDAQGLEAVRRVHAVAPQVPLVVLTGLDDESQAALALKEGVQDYLVKGQIESRTLLRALRYAVERKAIEETLYSERERAQVTLDSIGDAVISTDIAGNISYLNRAAERMTGWAQQEAAGRVLADVYQPRDAVILALVPDPLDAAFAPLRLSSNGLLSRRDGTEIPIEDSVAPIRDRQGRATGAVVVFRDVSAQKIAQQMTHSAQHDFLTGLPNRMLLLDRIGQAIAGAPRHGKQLALLYLDLDGFKRINDTLGHPVGDKLLQSVVCRLLACVRGADTVSRQGGDEFAVLLSEVRRPEDAAVSAEKILQALAQTHCIDAHELQVTTSIGVSIFPGDGQDAESLIRNADAAMYQAKKNGRHRFEFYRPGP